MEMKIVRRLIITISMQLNLLRLGILPAHLRDPSDKSDFGRRCNETNDLNLYKKD